MNEKAYAGEQYISYHDESYLPSVVHLQGWAGQGQLHFEPLTPLGRSLATALPSTYSPHEGTVADERERVKRQGPLQVLRRLAAAAQEAGLHLLAIVPYELAHVFDDLETDLPCLVEFQMVDMVTLPTRALPWDALAPTHPRPSLTLLEDTSPAFLPAFEASQEHLRAGDVFEIVLSRRFTLKTDGRALFAFLAERTGQLRAPFRFALSFPHTRVVGASPELLVRVCQGQVISRPISGSLRREGAGTLTENERTEFEKLLQSEKEKSELDMLIDLARHDLHRVCEDVRVSDYREALVLETVAHTQATVSGTLREGNDALDAFLSCLNAGTLVGAPKRKAMEIIRTLEGTPRGYYGGNLIHLRPSGDLRATILIRTCVLEGDQARLQAGATVLVESDARYEYWECGAKARGLLALLGAQDLAFSDADDNPPPIVQTSRVDPADVRLFFGAGYGSGQKNRTEKTSLRLLLVDNEDSFTFNLEALLASFGCSLTVRRNRLPIPDLSAFDGLVLSPGPSAPADAGFLLDYVRQAAGKLPVLGVCLGFQAMVEALGGELGRLEAPLHGKVRHVRQTEGAAHPFFAGLPESFPVARYHSLYARTVPPTLRILASDERGVPMALAAHKTEGAWEGFFGVQFHPESFLTGEAGTILMRNWLGSVKRIADGKKGTVP
ncbi:MAG: chorismate-binding protein [Silvanigrellales bacterium]|nr:chorismate-binding protein [Silvanigrellales bacterium]